MEGEESTNSSTEDGVIGDPSKQAFDEVETIYCKLPKESSYDLKLEHYDDAIIDNSFQSAWAGLDSVLIDEEFLFLEGKEADKIYAQLKQRQ